MKRTIYVHVLNDSQPWDIEVEDDSFTQEMYNIELAIRNNGTYRVPNSYAFVNSRYIVSATATDAYEYRPLDPPF